MNEDEENHEEEVSKEEYEFKALECELKCREGIDELKSALLEAFNQSKNTGVEIDESALIFHSACILADGACQAVVNGTSMRGIMGKHFHMMLLLISDTLKEIKGDNEKKDC